MITLDVYSYTDVYLQVNLKTGLKNLRNRDTCTACAGTMVLEFAALSRLTGDSR